ncbi:hypothetical protein ACJX0J_021126 [Zea mays]
MGIFCLWHNEYDIFYAHYNTIVLGQPESGLAYGIIFRKKIIAQHETDFSVDAPIEAIGDLHLSLYDGFILHLKDEELSDIHYRCCDHKRKIVKHGTRICIGWTLPLFIITIAAVLTREST